MGDSKNKSSLTPEERRRREAARKRRQRELKKRRRRRKILTGVIVAAVAVILILLGVLLYGLINSGSKQISAAGDTFVIAIDAGHGGDDVGMGTEDSYEKDIDLAVCEKLEIMLESQGFEVVMLRSDDSYLSRDERVILANKSGADLLISVHCNYSETDSTLTGAAVTYSKGDKEAATLAENISAYLEVQTGVEGQGGAAGEYTILDETDMPAVLVELGYLSNTEEAENLADDSYRNALAKGIAYGIIASLAD